MTELIKHALEAQKNSYSPYSKYRVGAALLAKDGRIFCGCNIENAAYSATVCAERTALFSAVSQGCREFEAIAIVGGSDSKTDFAYPCGACRQALSEFCGRDFKIIVAKSEKEFKEHTLGELLPESFSLR